MLCTYAVLNMNCERLGQIVYAFKEKVRKKKFISYKAINIKMYIWVGPITRKAQQECAVSLPKKLW